jgi:hypothetical protein
MLILNFTYPLRCLRVPPVEYHWSRVYSRSAVKEILYLYEHADSQPRTNQLATGPYLESHDLSPIPHNLVL